MDWPTRPSVVWFVCFWACLCGSGRVVEAYGTCSNISIPADVAWSNSTVFVALTDSSPTWTSVIFDAAQATATTNNFTASCQYSGASGTAVCVFLDAFLNSAVGPFFEATLKIEWPIRNATPTTTPPHMTFQKITNGIFYNDTAAFNFFSMNQTHFNVSTKIAGPNSFDREVNPPTVLATLQGMHTITFHWDNETLVLLLDSVEMVRQPRLAQDSSWPYQGGNWLLYLWYDSTVASSPTTTGSDTYIVLHQFDFVCIPPNNATVATTPAVTRSTTAAPSAPPPSTCPSLSGLAAQCDPTTGILFTNTSVDLRNQTTVLNVSGVSIQVNGSVLLGGGLEVDGNTRINSTGTVVFGGVLVINAALITTNGTVLVLANYNNHSGQFQSIEFANNTQQKCEVLSATPTYGTNTFSVLLTKSSKTDCSKHHKGRLALIVGCVVGGVILLAVIVAVVLLVFFKDSLVFYRAPLRRRTYTKS